jgi:hypothetical protein
MAVKTVYWSGSAGDKITITYSGSGNNVVQIQSDPNTTLSPRTKDISFSTLDGTVSRTITVSQAAANAGITISPEIFYLTKGGLPSNANPKAVIWSNSGWYLEGARFWSWGDATQESFNSDVSNGASGIYQDVLFLSPPNKTSVTRSRTLSVKSTDGSLTKNIVVQQAPASGQMIPSTYSVYMNINGTMQSNPISLITDVGITTGPYQANWPNGDTLTYTITGDGAYNLEGSISMVSSINNGPERTMVLRIYSQYNNAYVDLNITQYGTTPPTETGDFNNDFNQDLSK